MGFCSPPDTSTIGHHFHFGSTASFFRELLVIALYSSLEAYWTHSDLGGSPPGVITFGFFILFMGFLRQEHWRGLPVHPPVNYSLSELFTMTTLSWVALQGMAHSFIELCKPPCHNKAMIHDKDHKLCFKLGFSSTWAKNFQGYKMGLEKAAEQEIKLPTFIRGSCCDVCQTVFCLCSPLGVL